MTATTSCWITIRQPLRTDRDRQYHPQPQHGASSPSSIPSWTTSRPSPMPPTRAAFLSMDRGSPSPTTATRSSTSSACVDQRRGCSTCRRQHPQRWRDGQERRDGFLDTNNNGSPDGGRSLNHHRRQQPLHLQQSPGTYHVLRSAPPADRRRRCRPPAGPWMSRWSPAKPPPVRTSATTPAPPPPRLPATGGRSPAADHSPGGLQRHRLRLGGPGRDVGRPHLRSPTAAAQHDDWDCHGTGGVHRHATAVNQPAARRDHLHRDDAHDQCRYADCQRHRPD